MNGGIIIPMEVETSDLKKRMVKKFKTQKPEENFEEAYIKAILEKVDSRPSEMSSMAGLQKGGECVYLRVYDISPLNKAL